MMKLVTSYLFNEGDARSHPNPPKVGIFRL